MWLVASSHREMGQDSLATSVTIFTKPLYSQTCIKQPCIKRSPSIKQSVVKVPKKFILLITLNVTSFKRSPLLSGRSHLLQSPSKGISIVFTCIKRSIHKRKPYECALNVVILVINNLLKAVISFNK